MEEVQSAYVRREVSSRAVGAGSQGACRSRDAQAVFTFVTRGRFIDVGVKKEC